MDNDADFYKDGVDRVIELLRNTFGDFFKAYYDDEVEEVPESNLPCVMVRETISQVAAGATGTDDVDEQIVIIVALNRKDDLGGDNTKNLTGTKLRRIIKGRYPADHATKPKQYKEKTIMYVLRQNFTLATNNADDNAIDNTVEIDMDVARRGESETKEAYITLAIRTLAMVPDRN